MSFLPAKNTYPLKIKQVSNTKYNFYNWNTTDKPLYSYCVHTYKIYRIIYFKNLSSTIRGIIAEDIKNLENAKTIIKEHYNKKLNKRL